MYQMPSNLQILCNTLKCQQKASENVVCLSCLLHIFANSVDYCKYRGQTGWTKIRLLLQEQSDPGLPYLSKKLLQC